MLTEEYFITSFTTKPWLMINIHLIHLTLKFDNINTVENQVIQLVIWTEIHYVDYKLFRKWSVIQSPVATKI